MDRTKGFLNRELETRSWDSQVADLGARLATVVDHAYANAPAVKAKFDAAGLSPTDVRTVEDLAKVPVTTKMELVELQKNDPPFGGLLAVPMEEIEHVFQSPGPIYDPVAKGEGWGFEEAFSAAGFASGDLCMNTFGYQLTPAGMMLGQSLTNIGCAVMPTGVGEREGQIKIMKDLQIKGYVGMASFLLQIGEKAIEMGLDPALDLGLEVAFSIAEPLPDSLRDKVEQMFGLICRQGYGTADVGGIGYECFHRGGWHLTTRAIVEVVDPTDGKPLPMGEIGEVVVTPFHKGYPLIRFGTGDLSALDEGGCQCGRTGPKLRGWLGRADQLVKVKGMFVHPGQVSQAMGIFPELEKYRLVVTRSDERDALTLRAIATPGCGAEATDAIVARLREIIRLGCSVEWVDELPDDQLVLEDLRKWD